MKPTGDVYKNALIPQGFQKQQTPLFDKIVQKERSSFNYIPSLSKRILLRFFASLIILS